MEFATVTTLGGYKSHFTVDGIKTMCGREVSNGTSAIDMCKRCEKSAVKLTEWREKIGYYAALADTQDDVTSQAQPVKVGFSDTWVDVHVTSKLDGKRITYAHIPNGMNDPFRVATFVEMARKSGAFTDITTLSAAEDAARKIEETADDVAWDAHVKVADAIGYVPVMVMTITRHHVSYYAPADHSQCSHAFNQDENGECDSVDGRWLEGSCREISPAETTVIQMDADSWEEFDRTPSRWAEAMLDGSPLLDTYGLTWEPSGSPIGNCVQERVWLSARDAQEDETDIEFSVRLTDGWDTYQRAKAFKLITGQK
jgi:hypothetical protein